MPISWKHADPRRAADGTDQAPRLDQSALGAGYPLPPLAYPPLATAVAGIASKKPDRISVTRVHADTAATAFLGSSRVARSFAA
jgi:hypothetical protein